MSSITFPQHSGFGNQVQGLLPAIFLSATTGRPLVMPPLLGFSADGPRSASLNLEDARTADHWLRKPGCTNGTVDGRKEGLVIRSEEQIAFVCACMADEGRCMQQRGALRLEQRCRTHKRWNLCESSELSAARLDPALLPHGHASSRLSTVAGGMAASLSAHMKEAAARRGGSSRHWVDLRAWRAAHATHRAAAAASHGTRRLQGFDQARLLSELRSSHQPAPAVEDCHALARVADLRPEPLRRAAARVRRRPALRRNARDASQQGGRGGRRLVRRRRELADVRRHSPDRKSGGAAGQRRQWRRGGAARAAGERDVLRPAERVVLARAGAGALLRQQSLRRGSGHR